MFNRFYLPTRNAKNANTTKLLSKGDPREVNENIEVFKVGSKMHTQVNCERKQGNSASHTNSDVLRISS